jgi:hypothetical protein
MADLDWATYAAVTGAALVLWSFLFLTIRMHEQANDWGGIAADFLPLVAHLWFAAGHWRQVLGTLLTGAAGVALLAGGIYWREGR